MPYRKSPLYVNYRS